MPSYYAVVPATVRYDENLVPLARLLYGEITALCNEKGYCWASNQYFADLYKVSVGTISRWVRNLSDNNHIEVSLEVSPAGTQRKISISEIGVVENGKVGVIKNDRGAYQKAQEGVIKNDMQNTTFNNTINNTNTGDDLLFKSEEFKKAWDEWLQFRKQKKVSKYTEIGLKKTFKDLGELSGMDEAVAIKIIDQSISKGWQGLFALKNGYSFQKPTTNYENERQALLKNTKIIHE